MRQFNFILIFVVCLAVALFAMQNAGTVTVNVAPGIAFQSPLVVELLLACGFGAAIAWIFNVWTKAQFMVEVRQKNQELEAKESRISELNNLVVELESTVAQLPPSKRAEPRDGDSGTMDAKTADEQIHDVEIEAAQRVMS
jgi:uncharacterized integral membrane protein